MASDGVLASGLTLVERRQFTQRLFVLPLSLFLGLSLLWLVLQGAILAAPIWLAVLLAVPAGLAIAMLFVVGHDAAHNSLSPSRRVNQIIGRLAFLPALHALSLWDLSHNRTHHRYNSIHGIDYVWEPLSPAEYCRSGAARQAVYRLFRHPLGVSLYYLTMIWAPRLFVPIGRVIGHTRAVYWLDGVLVVGFLAAHGVAAVSLGAVFDKSVPESLILAILLPFLVWNAAISFVIFLHHTHPSVVWYADEAAWGADQGTVRGTACVRFPFPFSLLTLNIMEHNAHHLASGVPLYNLPAMQRMLEHRGAVVSWRFSWRAYARICRRCQLYDYEAGRWVTFNGKPVPSGA